MPRHAPPLVGGPFVGSTVNRIVYSSAANTFGEITTANSGVLVTSGAGVPSIATDIPTAVTIGGAYVYRASGTDVALADGGTNASLTASNGGIFYSTATAGAILAGTATANQVLLSGTSAAPAWSTATYPATTTANQILYSSGTNTVAGLATANSGILVTSGAGVPSIATDIPTAVTIGGAYVYRASGTDVALADGGTNASLTASNGGIFYSTATAGAILAGTATATQMLQSGASTTPAWSTSTWPATTTANQILYSSATNTVAGLATANDGILVTSGAGVPSIATDIPTAVTIGGAYVYRASGTDVPVADGGTGLSSTTAYAVICGGTTSTAALQSIAGVGTSGQVLTSNGAGALPTFQTISTGANPAGSGSEIQYRSNATTFGAVSGSSVSSNVIILTSGLSSTGAGTRSERMGASATAAGDDTVSIGNGASAPVANCTFIGSAAGKSTGSGTACTGVGYQAGTALTSGGNNTFLGSQAGAAATSGGSCTLIGQAAGSNVTTGNYHTAVGASAGPSSTSLTGTIALGVGAAPSASNQMCVGSSTSAISLVTIGNGSTSATPAGFTLQPTNASGTNISGIALTLAGGQGTGTGDPGAVTLQSGFPLASGTTLHTLYDRVLVAPSQTLTDATATALFDVALATLTMCGGQIFFVIECTDGTDMQAYTGTVQYAAVNKGAAYTTIITETDAQSALSAGTLTTAWTLVSGTNKVTVKVSADTSLTATTFRITFAVIANTPQAITLL